MDMANQARIKETAEKYGTDKVVVILGGAEAESAGLTAETVIAGTDLCWSSDQCGFGLAVYHIFELKDLIDPQVYDEQISMMEMVLDVEEIINEMNNIRSQYQEG